ncbi:MAG: hypothetical protein CVU05_06600 [Bacteroidetes bacterium HGW-Bacteroidetes-21]|jgi:hypothetical protein|nr:MAG: hypothetical protein CVU05_06600 [Bacteroidetes bacterium HGW-Bacteroidetes-21]
MKKIFYLLVVVVTITAIVISCKKDKADEIKTDNVLAAQENALAQNLFDDVFKQVDNASRKMDDSCDGTKSVSDALWGNCATVTIAPFDAVTWPKTVTVDFGTTNCLGTDLRNRRGKLIYTVSTWYRDSGCTIIVTPNNFYINDHKVEGTKTVINQGRNNDGYLKYSVTVNNALVTKPDGTTFTWNTSRIHTWVAGETSILNPYDDVYLIDGTANGVASDGGAFNITINTSLDVLVGCRWIRAGVLTLSSTGNPDVIVNYGSGDCDANAVATVNGVDYSFVMN